MVNFYRKHYLLCYKCMRITTLIIGIQACFASVLLASTIKAQTINLQAKDADIKEVFTTIEKQANVTFVYNEKTLKGIGKVNVNANNQQLSTVLSDIATQVPLVFKQAGKVIGVSRKMKRAEEHSSSPQPTVTLQPDKPVQLRDIYGKITDTAGQPISGVTVQIAGTGITTSSDASGHFILHAVPDTGIIVFSCIGYNTRGIALSPRMTGPLNIILYAAASQLKEVSIVSNGYQTISKERSTGSFDQIDNQTLNRATGTNILDRINGIASGVFFNPSSAFTFSGIYTGASTNIRETGVSIRGVSTLSPNTVGTDPLIVLDNFPYDGDLRNINPNDIESITVLKDAAAASIWGARAGNGVIVITTKKGHKNQKTIVDFNSNVTIGNKPNVFYDKNFLDSKDYIQAETYLFNQGYFNSDLTDTYTYPVISPAVQILAREQAGAISQTDAMAQLSVLAKNDVRNDYEKYIYQKTVNQQYSIGLHGGTSQIIYSASVGYDDNRDNLVRNGEQRLTVSSQNTYIPVKNLEITAGINYSHTNVQMNNQLGWGQVSSPGTYNTEYGMIPYALFANSTGASQAIPYGYGNGYIDSLQKLGFQDIHYRPLNELQMADNTAQISDLIFKTSATYHFLPSLNAQILYQNEHQQVNASNDQVQQSYYTSNLIDEFAVYNASARSFTYPFPEGDILSLNNTELDVNNLRGQLNYNQTFRKNAIVALAGAEINQSVATQITPTYYGYNSEFGTAVSNLDYSDAYPTNPLGAQPIPGPNDGKSITTYRYLSYFANAGYTYDNKYTVTLSGRKDGANIFGVNANDRIAPLWSAGLSWNASKEGFYHVSWLPYLKLRASYGFNGNVYNGSGYTTGTYSIDRASGILAINNLTAPNPDLQWEKVKNINLGLDFSAAKEVISGTIEFYRKNGEDLIENIALAPSSGFTSFTGNAASTQTNGIDVTLRSLNINAQFKWSSTLLFSMQKSRVTRYDVPPTASSIQTLSGNPAVDYPVYSLFSYKWAGIDQTNGNPEGYLNGKISEDYASIVNNYSPDSLKFSGSAVPTVFGSFRNDFSYHGFGLSFNIRYELGWYFRRPSINLNYQNVLITPNSDYTLAWTHPGQQTDIPSLAYPSNNNRNLFYQYSSVLIQSGNNIRWQDIRVSYDITKKIWPKMPFSMLQVYSYADNIGILWKANKYGLDPDAVPTATNNLGHTLPVPFTISFGLKATY